MSYRMLVLPNSKTMSPAVLKKIKALVDAGATVVGPKPEKSPSLAGYPQCDDEVRKLADEVWTKVQNKSPSDVLAAMGVKPDLNAPTRRQR